ncbi:MAG: right-handed parallel beta-helix repeat-containing protein [Treponema sp.]|nr:right-handed parallel beta-helix repeat-containing protein [Treponema sp.]
MVYYVDANASAGGNGSKESPFAKINDAAKIAVAGDEVLVNPGIYREYVNPVNGGTEDARITYRSTQPLGAVITGAESFKKWEQYQGDVYLARIPNKEFGDNNPYKTLVSGDWFIATYIAHLGEVFLNDKSLYETETLEGVLNPTVYIKSWDPDFTLYKWYTCQDEKTDETLIYANFQGKNPNEENVEITFRRHCFYPSEEGRGYITLSGFKVCKAGCQWAPPTAYQEGMIGPHWSKGWIIEDCEVSHAKCSGISLGKYYQPYNNNKWLNEKFKDGAQTERANICMAVTEGWTKERIGSHIVRRCHIHDCGQTGIVGHLGGVFSIIEDNHIHHINNKQNLAGAEIGGIKMHAAIDCIIRRNYFHNCTRGLWLDWQAQGTRVTQNLFHDNCMPFDHLMRRECMDGLGEDIFIEVSHGPTLVDNNILLSDRALKLATQGVALVHNYIAGSLTAVGRGVNNGSPTKASPRYTPYHVPHRTEIVNFMTILHGDTRLYNNIFVQKPKRKFFAKMEKACKNMEWDQCNITAGTIPYDEYPTYEEWAKQFEGYCGMGSVTTDRYYNPLPVWAGGNCFFNGAKCMKKEKDAYVDTKNKVTFEVKEENGKATFKTNVYDFMPASTCKTITTEILGKAFEPEQAYENPDGTPITFNTDFFGASRASNPVAGPFENTNKTSEWKMF